MSEEVRSLDDLHDDLDTPTPVDPAPADPNDPKSPVDSADSGNPEPIDPPADGEPASRPNLNDYVPTEDAPAIEQFLSQYGVLGGMIQFEDGEAKHFDELSEVEKFNVLRDLSVTTAPDIAEQYGLDDAEIDLINWVREQNKPIQESIEELAQARAAQLLALNNANSTDFTSMDDDAITMRWLKGNDPEATEEQLAEELSKQKESKLYSKNAASLRQQFVNEQQTLTAQQQAREQEAYFAELEQERSEIATAISGIKDIAGFEISDEDKNNILHDLLEVNEYGDSLFMEEVFSDPNRLFKAAWLYKNSENIFNQLEKYYKNEIAKAYQSGKTSTISGFSSNPVGGVRSSETKGNEDSSLRKTKIIDVDDLHND
jgi:uncharacterized ferredoxin-like protein